MLLMLTLTAMAAAPVDGPPDAAIEELRRLAWDRAGAGQIAAGLEHPAPEVRGEAVRLLGQLGTDVDRYVVPLVSSDDPDIARAAAEALALAPGDASPLVSAWSTGDPADDVRIALLDGLGRRGDATVIPLLTQALGRSEAQAVEAAHALGRLGRRKVEGAEAGRPALIRCLSKNNDAVVTACGWGLYRVGLDESATAEVAAVRKRAKKLPDVGRAWVVRALAAVEAPPSWASTDEALVVRVAAVSGPHVPTPEVMVALDHADPWVRDQALLTAAGRPLDEVESGLRARYDAATDPWVKAGYAGALSSAGAVPTPEDLVAHPRVAANWMGTAPPASWITLGEGPPARIAGIAGALMSRVDEVAEHPDADAILVRLMQGDDPVGWGAAAMLAGARGDVDRLVTLLGREDADTVQGALQAIAEADIREADRPRLAAAIAPFRRHPQSRLRADAGKALQHLGVDAPEVDAPTWGATPELPAPDAAAAVVVTTSRGDITIALHPDIAPRAVQAFVHLARQGVYDGIVWHRVVPAFVVQSGDPTGTGWGGPGFALPDEDSITDYVVGAVGFAKSGPDTAGSQWFITTVDQPHLTGDYTLFGSVTDGIDVALALRQGDRIETVTVVDR